MTAEFMLTGALLLGVGFLLGTVYSGWQHIKREPDPAFQLDEWTPKRDVSHQPRGKRGRWVKKRKQG